MSRPQCIIPCLGADLLDCQIVIPDPFFAGTADREEPDEDPVSSEPNAPGTTH